MGPGPACGLPARLTHPQPLRMQTEPGPICGTVATTQGSVPGHIGPGPALTNANCPADTTLGKLSIAATTIDATTIWILGFI